ncbi:DNA-directed RNA polymerase [Sporothrix bragantina]|uniref:DNA-directed RNA polymerase n=1 Tax=Sporothrix bragantina TaxID=671064 RepID=A0ABP0B0P4_9PEZI
MLARPAGCRHTAALRRIPSAHTRPALPTQPARLLRPLRAVGVDRRLFTTRPDRPEIRAWRPKTFYSGIGFLPERTLATALGDYAPTPLDEGVHAAAASLDQLPPSLSTSLATSLPTASSRYSLPSSSTSPHGRPPPPPLPLWELRPHNTTSPIVINDADFVPVASQRINTRGIPGDVDEMLSMLDACLHVGKLDRAALVLKRLSQPAFAAADIDVAELHARYLRAAVDQLIEEPNAKAAEELHKWYELEMCGKQPMQTPETIAYMLKASLLTTQGVRRRGLVDRYMGMAPGDSGLEVLYMTGILNDQDRATITDICRTYNFEADVDEADSESANLFEEALRAIDPEGTSTATSTTAATAATADAATATATPATEADASLETATTPAETPTVLGTPQKGMGLRVLKQTLSLFSEIPQGRDIASLSLSERREIQSRIERDCVDAAVERWKDENQALLKMGLNTSLTTASLNSRLYEWHKDLELRLSQELKKIELAESSTSRNREDIDRCIYGPFLRQSTPSRLAAVTIVSTLSTMAMQGADKGVPIGQVIMQIAKVTEDDIRLQRHTEAMAARGQKVSARAAAKAAAKTALRRSMRPSKGLGLTAAEAESVASPETAPTPDSDSNVAWPITIRAKVGAALLMMLIDTAKVTAVKEHAETRTLLSQQQPAFSRMNLVRRGKKVGALMANPTLVDLLKREPRGDFLARHLPMVVEPRPWQTADKGGFLEYSAQLVRAKDFRRDQKVYAEAAIARGDMDQVLKGLDVLGRTAWKVNRPIFDVMLEAWNTGEAIADIPPIAPNIAIPEEPDSSEDPMKRRNWLRAVKAAENQRSGLHSVRCFMNFQMEIARAFRDQTFYFPHNVDFRGRAYPIPPYFNHMGADHVRGLLTFAKGKALGEDGLKWLKVHLSNVYGFDKASLSERAAFAMDNLESIRDSARNPLHGKRWWLEAEDPWQCLAACMELTAAYDLEDPTQYVSHLPVHQDGTCNGLQHYAALGGDTWGAKQVNLVPGDRPADVYSAVADIVKESIAEDARRGDPNGLALDGKIKRKVVKQTVMTNVYGVTFAGARKQVLKQLDALYPTLHADTDIPPMVLASYIATKIFQALSTMFSGAHDIQHWLGEIGGRVCRSLTPEQIERIINGEPEPATTKGGKTAKASASSTSKSSRRTNDEILGQFRSTLVWTTPLQMPVVQPYRKANTRAIDTCLQDLILSMPSRSDPVHRRKQLQAFPPNFIHSLDASHMLLSALECDALGLQFAAVHDSFWTHAADVNTMNRVLRDAFVRIHSEDVVGRLAREFEVRYRGSLHLAKITGSSPIAKKIQAWRKTQNGRGLSLKDELVLEQKRLDLLQSDDPARVAEGRKMVTPASIFAKMSAGNEASAEAVIEGEDLSEFSLGSIPADEAAAQEKQEKKLAKTATTAAGKTKKRGKEAAEDASASSTSTSTSRLTGGMSLDGMGSTMGDIATGDEVDMPFDEHDSDHDASLMDDAETDDMDESLSAADAEIAGTGHFEARLRDLKKPLTKSQKAAAAVALAAKQNSVEIWVPLTFPEIPAKGDFDVQRLKESDYFFS